MVLRVDVMEAALRARYGVDPVELPPQRRVIALTPGGRLLDDALVDELAEEPELTLLCGRYEGFDERILEHFATDAVSIGRYVLVRRRAGGDGGRATPCCASCPGALGHDDSRARGVVLRGARGRARVPALHAPGRVARLARCPTSCCRATTREIARVAARSRSAEPPSGDGRLADVRYHDRPP